MAHSIEMQRRLPEARDVRLREASDSLRRFSGSPRGARAMRGLITGVVLSVVAWATLAAGYMIAN